MHRFGLGCCGRYCGKYDPKADAAGLLRIESGQADGCGSSYDGYLFCARDICPRRAWALHFMGDLRCVSGPVPTNSPLAAYCLADLGNSYGTSSLAMSVDLAGKLARKQSRNRA